MYVVYTYAESTSWQYYSPVFICTYYYGLSPLELSIASENAISVACIVSPSYYLSLLLFPEFAHSLLGLHLKHGWEY